MRPRFAILILALLLLIHLAPLLAQEEEEEPLPPPSRPSAGKIGGAGGFTPLWLFWDVNAMNEFIPSNAGKFGKTPMVLYGGAGYAYIMLVENMRIGGMGAGGSAKTSVVEYPVVGGQIRRDLEVGINFGGVTLEYAIPIFERLDIVPGVLFGGGGVDIKMTRDDGTFKTWQSLWNEFENNTQVQNVQRNLNGSFFVVQPSLFVEFAVLRWLGIRVGASYVSMSAPSWKTDDQFDLVGVPTSIRGNGWTISTGIFAGTFLF